MNSDHIGRRSSQNPKFIASYSKLFQGFAPLSPTDAFFSNLLILEVDRAHLQKVLHAIPKEACLGPLKVIILSCEE